jgi:hypothetical protein
MTNSNSIILTMVVSIPVRVSLRVILDRGLVIGGYVTYTVKKLTSQNMTICRVCPCAVRMFVVDCLFYYTYICYIHFAK